MDKLPPEERRAREERIEAAWNQEKYWQAHPEERAAARAQEALRFHDHQILIEESERLREVVTVISPEDQRAGRPIPVSALSPGYKIDGLSLRQALERFEIDYPMDLSKDYEHSTLRSALVLFFPFAPLSAPPSVRELTMPERIASLVAAHWPIDERTGQAPEVRWPPDSPERVKAARRSRAIAVKKTITYLERLDRLYPQERTRTGTTRSISTPNYAESVKSALQEFGKYWPTEELKAHAPPITPTEFGVLMRLEYESYIDRLYSAAVAMRVERAERKAIDN